MNEKKARLIRKIVRKTTAPGLPLRTTVMEKAGKRLVPDGMTTAGVPKYKEVAITGTITLGACERREVQRLKAHYLLCLRNGAHV